MPADWVPIDTLTRLRPVPPDGTTIVGGATVKDGEEEPEGEMVAVKFTLPVKPFRLVTLMTEFPAAPLARVRVDEEKDIEKYGRLLKLADCTVAAAGVGVPFDRVTQIPPETLVEAQPDWKSNGVRTADPVML